MNQNSVCDRNTYIFLKNLKQDVEDVEDDTAADVLDVVDPEDGLVHQTPSPQASDFSYPSANKKSGETY